MRGRDPRLDPRSDDVLDDDPPLPPLRVVERIGLSVYGLRRGQNPSKSIPWRGTLAQWRKEMADAVILKRAK